MELVIRMEIDMENWRFEKKWLERVRMLVCDGCFLLFIVKYYKIMDEFRKELVGLRIEIRVNS